MAKHLFKSSRRQQTAGFSLVEMLIVIALIAVVGTLLIGRIGNLFGGAQEDVAKQFVENSLKAPMLKYRIDTGSYPSTAEGIKALYEKPGSASSKWKGPYIEKIPEDPWGNPYNYKYPGTQNSDGYDLWSSGPDGSSGTADDIGNWE